MAKAQSTFPITIDNTLQIDRVVGDTITSDSYDIIEDAIFELETKIGIDDSAVTGSIDYLVKTPKPKFSAHKNGGDQESIGTGTWTKITFTTEEDDIGSTYDAPNSKWVPGIIGKAHIDGCIWWASGVDQTQVALAIYKNGVLYKTGPSLMESGNGVIGSGVNSDVKIDAITDYFEIYCYQGSGSNKNIRGEATYTWLMGHMLP